VLTQTTLIVKHMYAWNPSSPSRNEPAEAPRCRAMPRIPRGTSSRPARIKPRTQNTAQRSTALLNQGMLPSRNSFL
jgi:hypothetical protein